MSKTIPQQAVIISDAAFKSDDPLDVIQANIDVVNALLEEHLRLEEISTRALQSYFVDYFLDQFENGGFSQFVYNSRWSESIDFITDGFAAMGATAHHEYFENVAGLMMDRPGIEGLKRFFGSEYFGDDNPVRDILEEYSQGFLDIQETEDLREFNANWLRQQSDLVVLTEEEIATEVYRRGESLPDREERIAEARANEPRYVKVIRALCGAVGHELNTITAGDRAFEYEGEPTIAWHFLTDQGHHHMADLGAKAIMFKGHTDEVVCEIEVPEEIGEE